MGASYDFDPQAANLSTVNMDVLRRRISIIEDGYDPAVAIDANLTGEAETQNIRFGDQVIELTFNGDGTVTVATSE